MNIFLPALVDKFRQLTSIQCFHIERAGYISGIDLFPAHYQPGKTVLDPTKAYVCEYRDLRLQEPTLELPPLICVIEPGISVDEILFRSRLAITVSGHTVSEVLVMLSQLLYNYGCNSSELTDLSHSLLKCKNIQELIDVGYQALQNPIIVVDGEQRIVAFTDPHIISASSYHKLVQLEHLPVGRPNDLSDRALGNNVFALPASEGVGQPEGLGMALTVKSKIIGYLNVMAFNHPCTEHDTYIMEMLGNLLAIELLQRPHLYSLSSDMKWEHFFREILDNTAGDINDILAEQQALNLKMDPCMCVIVVQIKDESPAPCESFYILSKQLASCIHNTFGFLYRNSAFLILNAEEEIVDMDGLLSSIAPMLETYNLMAGISNWFSSIHQLRAFTFQARKALQLGNRIHRNGRFYYYKDYSIYRMLELCLQSDSMEAFCSPELLRLYDYSQQNENDLYETLRVYLSCGRNKAQTAREMYVHISTIKYRMTQIQEIINMDLENDDNALKLMLSYKLLDSQELLQQNDPLEEFWKV